MEVNPSDMKCTNKSMIATPVTISAFNNGIFESPSITFWKRSFIAVIPIHASVPINVAIKAANVVSSRYVLTAESTSSF